MASTHGAETFDALYQSDGGIVYTREGHHTAWPDGQTRVELEHRHIGPHGPGAAGIYQGASGPGGWPGILDNYAKIAAA